MTAFYYEVKRFGKWWPRTSFDAPIIKTFGGAKRVVGVSGTVGPEIRGETEISDSEATLGLDALQERFGPRDQTKELNNAGTQVSP